MATTAKARDRLGFLVHDVSRLRRNVVDKVLKPMGITRAQWWVLTNLAQQRRGMVQTELAQILDIGKVAVGGLIDRLEANGFVRRLPSRTDRRAKHVEITPKGTRLLARVRNDAAGIDARILKGLPAKDIATAERVLSAMKSALIELDTESRQANGVALRSQRGG